MEPPKDCFSCAHSFVTEDDELHCEVHDKIVEDLHTCEDYN